MKRNLMFFMGVISLLALCVMPSVAQDAAAETIINRYNAVTGLDNANKSGAMNSSMMECEINTAGQKMQMSSVISKPGKFRINIKMAGQDMLMVMDGDKGWIKQGDNAVQPMPQPLMDQFAKQADMSSNFMWTSKDYSFASLGEKTVNGTKVVGVKVLVKVPMEGQPSSAEVWFDTATGLALFSNTQLSQGGQTLDVKTTYKDYKQFGIVKAASKYEIEVGGGASTMTVSKMEFDYPTEPWMFAKPE